MGNRISLKVGQVQPERKVANRNKEGEFFRVLDFMASTPTGAIEKIGIFNKPELFSYIKVGETIDGEITDKERIDQQGNKVIDHNLVNIYIDGKPIIQAAGRGGTGGGWNREDPVLRRKSYALSYAKDLCVAGKIELIQIIPQAKIFDEWLGAVALSSTPSDAQKQPVKADPPGTASKQAEKTTPHEQGSIPLTAVAVYNFLVKLAEQGTITQEQAKNKVAELGGKGKNAWGMVESLAPDKLTELHKWVTEKSTDIPF